MSFLNRKSGVYHEDVYQEDFEIPRRRRLSKPYTNSSANASTSSLTTQKKSTGKPTEEPPIPLSPHESREALRSHLFASSTDLELAKFKSNGSIVASLTAIFENTTVQASASQSSVTTPKMAQQSLSHRHSLKRNANSHKPSISSLGSKDQHADNDLGNISPCSSLEKIAEDQAPPPRRVASFIPGVATRVPSLQQDPIHEETQSAIDDDDSLEMKKVRKQDAATESGELWSPPPRENRPETPMNLEYGHIGRIGLGSLRVVNGASSPAPSDMSRQDKPLWRPVERRDTSSVYPESEIGTIKSRKTVQSEWEDEPLPQRVTNDETPTTATTVARTFSFRPGSEARFSKLGMIDDPAELAEHFENPAPEDTTKNMAEEYIAGLPKSPFASSSPPMSPQTPYLETQSHSSPPSRRTTISEPTTPKTSQDVPSSPHSERSVRRYEEKKNSRRSFVDETLGSSPEPDKRSSPLSARIHARQESPVSFFSAAEFGNDVDEHFKSAVELQPPRTRSTSPQKFAPRSPLRTGFTRKDLSQRPGATKSDSGYSSNTSLNTIVPLMERGIRGKNDNETSRDEKRSIRFPFRKMVQKPNKAVLVKATPLTTTVEPISAKIESASALTSTTSLNAFAYTRTPTAKSVPSSPIKPKSQTKKLQKERRKSTVEVARELVVQRLASVECFNIPPVSKTARANLAMRSEAVPELERTYRTQNHTATDPNASSLSLAQQFRDMRFPSPEPAEEQDRSRRSRSRSHSRTRRRSLSRPRSWFGWSKEETGDQERGYVQPHQTDLNDLGSVINLLGGNPYDIASTNPKSVMPPSAWHNKRPEFMRRRTSPSNITNAHRPRSMMDDEAASRLSKSRRYSGSENTPKLMSRHSFDDRGGVPGRVPHSARLSIDAPPLPPMPSADEINRRYSYQLGLSPQPNYFANEQDFYSEPVSIDEPTEAPPPPPHSPRPGYIGYDETERSDTRESYEPNTNRTSRLMYNGVRNADFADEAGHDEPPPPPSHSPRPIDVTEKEARSRDVSWTSQANAWEARRRSASAALRDSPTQVKQNNFTIPRKPVPSQSFSNGQDEPFQSYRTAYDAQCDRNRSDWPHHHERGGNYEYQNEFPSGQLQENNEHMQHQSRLPTDYDDYSYEVPSQNHVPQPRPQKYIPYPGHSQPIATPGFSNHGHKRAQTWDVHDEWQAVAQRISPMSQSPSSYNFYAEYNLQKSRSNSQNYDDRHISVQQHPSNPRPTSGHSRKSLADELYLEPLSPSQNPAQHSPRVGRYSGGLEYNYDRFSRGIDGSAGTRSASTAKGNAIRNDGKKRSSWLDMDAYGVDLMDVPVMGVPIGATGSKMIYR